MGLTVEARGVNESQTSHPVGCHLSTLSTPRPDSGAGSLGTGRSDLPKTGFSPVFVS